MPDLPQTRSTHRCVKEYEKPEENTNDDIFMYSSLFLTSVHFLPVKTMSLTMSLPPVSTSSMLLLWECCVCVTWDGLIMNFVSVSSLGCQLEVQNIGATSSESSYIMGQKENEEENAITKKIFQQEILNLRKKADAYRSSSNSSSREGSVHLDNSNSTNRNRLGSTDSGNSVTNRSYNADNSNDNNARFSHSNSPSSVGSTRSNNSPEKLQNNSNASTPISLQNILNKFNAMGGEKLREKSLSPTGSGKSILGRLSEIKNNLANNNSQKVDYCT